MRMNFLLIVFLFPILAAGQQSGYSRMNGEWQTYDNNDSYIRIGDGKVQLYEKDAGGTFKPSSKLPGIKSNNTISSSLVGTDNASIIGISQDVAGKTTTTGAIHLFYLSPDLLYAEFVEYDNKIRDTKFPEESWQWGDASKSSVGAQWSLLFPRIRKKFNFSKSMASSSSYISIESIFNTTQYTAVKFRMKVDKDGQTYSLHAPGTEHAFVITDERGYQYKLLGQYGFGGYKSHSNLKTGDEFSFFVFFNRMPDNVKRISIREGTCTEGCWNFYDINLN